MLKGKRLYRKPELMTKETAAHFTRDFFLQKVGCVHHHLDLFTDAFILLWDGGVGNLNSWRMDLGPYFSE